MAVADVDTPALLVDLDALEANIAKMAAALRGSAVRLRPHAKAHKCPEIARRQMAAGAVGVCCQKPSETEAMVAAGVPDVLIANEVVGAPKLARVAALAQRARVAICVDDGGNAAELERAASQAAVRLDVLVEVDVGARRCGVEPAQALKLARLVSGFEHLRFCGLQAYHGSAQHVRSIGDRRDAVARSCERVREARDRILESGLPCETVTGAGTGTFVFELESGIYTEIQPGSYVFMDADYGQNAWEGLPRFEQSLHVWTTVMSVASARDRVVVDAGLKAHSVDSGMPLVADRPDLRYTRASDEHGVIEGDGSHAMPRLGDKLRLVPGHCDPTVNLHDWIVCVREGTVEAVWPISARGALL
ncbi:MAG: DSD1 family PLP-dependent enzyme [Acidobacteriota bacterium]